MSILLQLVVFRAPATPALNRWTQLYPALAYWCVCAHLPNKFMARIWGMAFERCRGPAKPVQLDLLAPADDGVLSGVNAVRAGKVLRWISDVKTPIELLVICLAMRPVMNLMGYLFREEGADSAHSVTTLMEPGSPDWRVVRFMVDQLAHLDAEFWIVYAGEGWDSFRLQLAMDTFLTIAGGIWWRVGRHLDLFPWRLWHVVNPEMSVAEERKQHADRLVRCCPSCVDPWFTRPLLNEYGATDIARPGSIAHEKVLTSLQKCRATNVMSELRFARLTKHMVPNRYGRAPSIPSMATKHTLAELASMQHRAVAKWEKEEAVPKIDAPEWTSKASSSWHAFFKAKRREGLDMNEIGELWRSLDEEEKHAFRSLASDESAACKPYEDLHEPAIRPHAVGNRGYGHASPRGDRGPARRGQRSVPASGPMARRSAEGLMRP